jgi:hypothetical protein
MSKSVVVQFERKEGRNKQDGQDEQDKEKSLILFFILSILFDSSSN